MILLFMQVKSAFIPGNEATSIPSVVNYFPQIQMDLSRVKWGHGVNSRAQLGQSLKGNNTFYNVFHSNTHFSVSMTMQFRK